MATLTEKKAVVADLVDRLKNTEAVYIVEYSGMSVSDVNELRGEFRKEDIAYKVYKNTMVRRAMKEAGGFDELLDKLEYQNAFIFSQEDLGKPAKILKKFSGVKGKPAFKMALIEGQVFESEQLNTLAAMKSKSEIIGDIIGLLLSPVSNIIGGLQAQGANIAGAIREIEKKGNQ